MRKKSDTTQYDPEEDGHPKCNTAPARATAANSDPARLQVSDDAKKELAGLVETRVAQLISSNIANMQLSTVDAESESKVVASAKNMVAMTLSGVRPIVVLYRDNSSMKKAKDVNRSGRVKKGKIQIQVRLFYSEENASNVAKKAIKKTLQEDLKNNEEDLKKLMDL